MTFVTNTKNDAGHREESVFGGFGWKKWSGKSGVGDIEKCSEFAVFDLYSISPRYQQAGSTMT